MLKNLDSLLFYVSDVGKTAEFYRELGFKIAKTERGFTIAELKDFELHFHDKNEADQPAFRKEALAEPKGAGLYIYVEVDDIDAYFTSLKEKGIRTSSEPRDWPWGNREFALRDPDGYKLVFYQQIRQ